MTDLQFTYLFPSEVQEHGPLLEQQKVYGLVEKSPA